MANERTQTAEEALRRAFLAHYESLLRMSVLITGEREAAEDLVQETFVRAARVIPGLDSHELRPYLRATAVNLWRNRLRRMRLERRVRAEAPSASSASSYEEHDAMWAAITSLPPRQRACIVLRYYEDLNERDTARVMGCSVGTVKAHTSRAIAQLRKVLNVEH